MTTLDDRVAELRVRYGNNWSIWTSDQERIWATRKKRLDYNMQQAGCVATLDADTCKELEKLLDAQDSIRVVRA